MRGLFVVSLDRFIVRFVQEVAAVDAENFHFLRLPISRTFIGRGRQEETFLEEAHVHHARHVKVVLGDDVVDGDDSIFGKVHKMDHFDVALGFVGLLICHVEHHVLEHGANLRHAVEVSLEEALPLSVPHLEDVLVADQLSQLVVNDTEQDGTNLVCFILGEMVDELVEVPDGYLETQGLDEFTRSGVILVEYVDLGGFALETSFGSACHPHVAILLDSRQLFF